MKRIQALMIFYLLVGCFFSACVPLQSPTAIPTSVKTISPTKITPTETTPVISSPTPTLETSYTPPPVELPFDPAQWTIHHLETEPGIPSAAYAISIVSAKDVWVGTNSGLWHFIDDRQENYLPKDGLLSEMITLMDIAPNGNLWLGYDAYRGSSTEARNSVSKFDGKNWKSYAFPGPVEAILCAPDGKVWVYHDETDQTSASVSYYQNQTWHPYDAWEKYKKYAVRAMGATDDGSIWLGTDINKIFRLQEGNVTEYELKELGFSVSDFAVAPDGSLWATTGLWGGSILHFDGQKWVGVSGYDSNLSTAIAIAQDGTIWAGQGFFHEGKMYKLSTWPWVWIHDIKIAPDGAVWFGTLGGVVIYREIP